jgi:hypothetical protein
MRAFRLVSVVVRKLALPVLFEPPVEIVLKGVHEALPTGLILILQHVLEERDNLA